MENPFHNFDIDTKALLAAFAKSTLLWLVLQLTYSLVLSPSDSTMAPSCCGEGREIMGNSLFHTVFFISFTAAFYFRVVKKTAAYLFLAIFLSIATLLLSNKKSRLFLINDAKMEESLNSNPGGN